MILHTLGLTHPDWSTPVYLVRDHQDFTAKLEDGQEVTFTAAAFEITLPELKTSSVPQIRVVLDNVSGEIFPLIDAAATSGSKVTMTYRPYLSTDTTAPQTDPPLELILSEITATTYQIAARAHLSDKGRRAFPAQNYALKNFPALANF